MEETVKRTKAIFIITGFGAFGTVEANPTTTIIEMISDEKSEHNVKPSDEETRCEYHVLQVSVQAVDQFIANQLHRLAESGEGGELISLFFVHLGVDSGGTSIKLEQRAYNNMSFRIPDTQGFQPQNTPIAAHLECDAPCDSEYHIEDIWADLHRSPLLQSIQHKYPQELVCLSLDPGRYLCNYLYYRTSALLRNGQDFESRHGELCRPLPANVAQCKSIFIHVPPFDQIAVGDQVLVVKSIVEAIQNREGY